MLIRWSPEAASSLLRLYRNLTQEQAERIWLRLTWRPLGVANARTS